MQTGSIAIINGFAMVGDSIAPMTRIPEQGNCVPNGKGLHAPGFHGSGKNKAKPTELGARAVAVNKEVFYRLAIPAPNATFTLTDTNNPARNGLYRGSLDVCGIVSPGPGGIGAACGSSTGRDGKGKLKVTREGTTDTRVYMVHNVAWPPAVAGVLEVYGHITEVASDTAAGKRTKLTAKGTFGGRLRVSGVDQCIQPKPGGGARTFSVLGTVATEALGKPAPKARETKLKKQN